MKVKMAIHRVSFVEKPDKEADFDWEYFNSAFENQEVDVMDLCNYIYIGRAYCPWMKGKRKVENFELAQHIAVDIDTGDKRGSLDHLSQHPLVLNFGAVIHETPSHTPYAPRARVIFLLDEPISTAVGYKAALQVVYDLFDGADPACVDAARFFFGNGKLSFYRHTEGIWFDPDACLPLAELRRMARLRQQRQQEARRAQMQTPAPDLTPTPDVLPLRDLQEELRKVDAYAMSYEEWMKVVAALGHVYGPSAFGVAKAWSDKPGKEPLTENKWRSLVREHPKAAGYGTLVRALKEYAR